MSRSADHASAKRRSGGAEPRPHADDGFTLLEVLVSLGVLTVVMVAVLPQLIAGIQSTATARQVSQAKGVAQGQLERMRNLPYSIAPAAGDYVDLLDYHYRNLTAPTSTPACTGGGGYTRPAASWTGYVPPGGVRCSYEPATGAFYRSVLTQPAGSGIGSFTLLVDTQFLSLATPPVPVTPASGFDTQVAGRDQPASVQVGVTVTVFYDRRGSLRPVSTYTQIARRTPATERVRVESTARVVDVGSVTSAGVPLTLAAGVLDLQGSLAYGSTVSATLSSTSAQLATGEQGAGASESLSAPPSVGGTPSTAAPGTLPTYGCAYACWSSTRVAPPAVSADQGLPNAGSATAPGQALVADAVSNDGLTFGNALTGSSYLASLKLRPSLVRLDPAASPVPSSLAGCAPGTGGTPAQVVADGFLRTTSTSDASTPGGRVESCSVARATPIELFPTDFAPEGVVRIELQRSSASCVVQGSAHAATASYDYRAVVSAFDGSGYVELATVTPGQATDTLANVDLTRSVGGGMTLDDYISSWSGLTASRVVTRQETGTAEVKLPGVVTVTTDPVRDDGTGAADPASAVSLTVGALECVAEDLR